jgi:hypothetical protein
MISFRVLFPVVRERPLLALNLRTYQVKEVLEGDGLMSGFGSLKINQTNDWTSLSKIVIRTDNRDLLNSLILKTAEMSGNGFGKIIYNFGNKDSELRIFSQLGTSMNVLSHLLDGQDYNRLNTAATIETIN